MIISASRRTDIPAFYAEWFMQRVREGFFYRSNPFNSNQISGFSLKPEHVDAICFWSKYPRPLMCYLDELDQRGLRYYFQFTLNPYDSAFEPHLPSLDDRISLFRELSGRIGAERVVWRFDPLILSDATPVSWHLEQGGRIAALLRNSTRRLVFSFYDFYGRGQGSLHRALKGSGVRLDDFTLPERRSQLEEVAGGLARIAAVNGMEIFSCCEEADLEQFGIGHGACIDGELVRKLSGGRGGCRKDRNQRAACRCVESVDMGMYNSCRFDCSYCYANSVPGVVDGNCRKHVPGSPLLLGNWEGQVEIRISLDRKKPKNRI